MRLSIAVGAYGHTDALRSGRVRAEGVELELVEVRPVIAAFRRMIRELEFDVCELAPTTYVIAREARIPITAIPVFLMRRFHSADVLCRVGTEIREPKDLEHRRVGLRAYSVTTGLWIRGLLERQYGVDHRTITWVVDDEEHVTSLKLPDNVVRVPGGESIADLFTRGEIDAAVSGPAGIGRAGAPAENWERATRPQHDFYPLFPAAAAEDRHGYHSTGIYPLHGLICIKQEVLKRAPWVARSLFTAFEESKAHFLRQLSLRRLSEAPEAASLAHYRLMQQIVGPDPLPYGVAQNERSLEALLDFAQDQSLITGKPKVRELFEAVAT